jgi:hypothetical protein
MQQTNVTYEGKAKQQHLLCAPKIISGKRTWKKFAFVKRIFLQNVTR